LQGLGELRHGLSTEIVQIALLKASNRIGIELRRVCEFLLSESPASPENQETFA